MSVSFDPTFADPISQTRLLAADFDLENPDLIIFQDEAYQTFLNLNNQSVRLAAAQALDVVAINETLVQKMIKLLDLTTNGPAVSSSLKAQATELRRQEYEGDGDMTGFVDYAELVYDTFTARQRAVNQWLRQGP